MGSRSENKFKENCSETNYSLESKMKNLEEIVLKFQAEVNMKMKIVERVLTTRNAQFLAQKKLLEQELDLHQSILTQWSKLSDLAEHDVESCFENIEDNVITFGGVSNANESPTPCSTKRKASPAFARRQRKRKHANQSSFDDTSSEMFLDVNTDVPDDLALEQDVKDCNQNCQLEDMEKDFERKVFVNHYTENEAKLEEGLSSAPIWKYYLREEAGQLALCKLCDDIGVQRVLKLKNGSVTASLYAHLRIKHTLEIAGSALCESAVPSDPLDVNNQNPAPLEFITSQKGSQLLVLKGFVFVKDGSHRKDKFYWRCVEHKNMCSARCVMTGNTLTSETGYHNHSESDLEKRRRQLKNLSA